MRPETRVGLSRRPAIGHREQNEDLQHDALTAAGCKRIYTDNASGAIADRPELGRVLDYVRNGDGEVVVWRLDRLGRSLKHLIELVEDMQERGIVF